MSEVLAYLAGVIDSDGSISIGIDMSRVRLGKRKSPAITAQIHVSQIKPQAIQLLKETLGGGTTTRAFRTKNGHDMHRWFIYGGKAADAVKKLMPHLRLKHRQAELIIALDKIRKRGRKANTNLTGPHMRELKPEVIDEMMVLVKEVRSLNDTRNPI